MLLRIFFILTLLINTIHANSLEELWSLTEKNSPGFKARAKQIESIQLAIDALPVWYKPDVFLDLGYSAATNFSDNSRSNNAQHGPLARIVAEWNLWDGGRTYYGRIVGEKNAKAQKWKQAQLMVKLKQAVSSLYLRIAYLIASRVQLQEEKRQYLKLIQLLRPRLRIEKVGNSDIVNVQIRLSKINSDLKARHSLINLLKEQLSLSIGFNKDQSIPYLSKIKVPQSESKQILEFDSLPTVRLEYAEMEALRAQKSLAKRNLYYPSISIQTYGGYASRLNALNTQLPEIGGGIKFSIPIISRRDRTAQLSSQEAQIASAHLDIQQELIRVKVNFNLKNGKMKQLRVQLNTIKRLITKSKNNLKLSYREFARGVKAPSDMLTSIETLFNLQKESMSLKLEWLTLATEVSLLKIYSKSNKPNKQTNNNRRKKQ